jgi:hypothetical protein
MVPMDIDGAVLQRKPLICFNCRKEGHIERQCPEPKKPQVRTIHEEVCSIGNTEFLELMNDELKVWGIPQDFSSDSQ